MITMTQNQYGSLRGAGLSDQQIQSMSAKKGVQIDSNFTKTYNGGVSTPTSQGPTHIVQTNNNGQQFLIPIQNALNSAGNFIKGTLSKFLPTVGMLTGSIAGGAAAGPFGAIPAAAGGAALGELGKEALQGKKLNTTAIRNEAAIGAASEAGGEAILGVAGALLPKIPIIGPLVEGVKDIGKSISNKLFGAGELKNYAEGATSIEDTASKYGLTKANTNSQLATLWNKAKNVISDQYDKVFQHTTDSGIFATWDDIENALKESSDKLMTNVSKRLSSKVPEVSQASRDILKSVDNTIADYVKKNYADTQSETALQVLNKQFKYPIDLIFSLKEAMSKGAEWAAEQPSDSAKLFRMAYSNLKDLTETMANKSGEDIGGLNEHYWNLQQIGEHIQGLLKGGERQVTGRMSQYQRFTIGTPILKSVNQAIKTLPPTLKVGIQKLLESYQNQQNGNE